MARERAEVEAAMRAVEAAEHARVAGSPESRGGENVGTAAAAERQLAALMEFGFHAEAAMPLCDGVTSIEELVETLISQGQGAMTPR